MTRRLSPGRLDGPIIPRNLLATQFDYCRNWFKIRLANPPSRYYLDVEWHFLGDMALSAIIHAAYLSLDKEGSFRNADAMILWFGPSSKADHLRVSGGALYSDELAAERLLLVMSVG